MNYTNEICNGCGRKFTEEDDIVTCPECGTPQHRECWLKEHKCVNEHLHEDGFEWKPKHREEEKKEEPQFQTRPCPFCGHENPVDAKECANCSQPFEMFGRSIFPPEQNDSQPHDPMNDASRTEYSYKPPFQIDYNEPENPDSFKPYTENGQPGEPQAARQMFIFGSNAYEAQVLGEETKDFTAFTRASIPSYYKKFKRFEHGKKFSFNFAALIFGPLWFFFRKLFKEGIIFTAITLCLTMALYAPLSQAMDGYYDLREEMAQVVQGEDEPTAEQLEAINNKMLAFSEKHGGVIVLFGSSMVLLHFVCALCADSLYKKKFLKDVSEAAEESQGVREQKYMLILRKGGISLFMPVLAYGVQELILSLLVRLFFK